jgi:hypothetical protein
MGFDMPPPLRNAWNFTSSIDDYRLTVDDCRLRQAASGAIVNR